MKHFVAMQSDNPALLKEIHATNQAGLSALFEDMMIAIVSDGVTLRNPAYSFSKEGDFRVAEYMDDDGNMNTIEEVKAHPLLKPLFELLSKNNLSLSDLNMTPKVVIDQGITAGALDNDNQSKEQLSSFQNQTAKALEGMTKMIERSKQSIQSDPVLQEFQTEENLD